MCTDIQTKPKEEEADKSEAVQVMKKLNDTNWQYLVTSFTLGQLK